MEPETSKLTWRFWLTAIQVRLRFFLLLLALSGLFAIWPWLSATWDNWYAQFDRTKSESAVSGGSEFFCPMDPGVVSAWPAICPICNMDLIRRSKSHAQILPAGVLARMQLSPYRLTLAGVRTVAVERDEVQADDPMRLRVPVSAILYWDRQPLVYIESMPGMFDAVPVTLQSRAGDAQVVTGDLQAGQRVAVVGALLLDAESRLHPNASTQYFGASQQSALASQAPILPTKAKSQSQSTLSSDEQQLVDAQKLCPVTEAPLGSMGAPVFVDLKGRKVALCCKGCTGRIKTNPDKYIEWLAEHMPTGSAPLEKQ